MDVVYASLLLHKVGKEINEANVEKVLVAAGANVDKGRIKMVVDALKGINIDEAIKNAMSMSVAPAAVPAAAAAPAAPEKEKEKEKEKKEEEKKEGEALEGLADLFGF
ncbi:MAG: 50S ribosomal protein P1 [Candidatus Korarchaeota archaeon]